MDTGRSTGGIFWLRELIEEHASEIAFDFRSQFGLSYLSIGREVTWGEAIRLASRLFSLTDSHLQAAVSGWEYPVSQEWIVLSHVYDLLAAVNSKNKPKPYPTPWKKPKKKIGNQEPLPRDKVIEALNYMNPKENDG
jgi:hypothetical protein